MQNMNNAMIIKKIDAVKSGDHGYKFLFAKSMSFFTLSMMSEMFPASESMTHSSPHADDHTITVWFDHAVRPAPCDAESSTTLFLWWTLKCFTHLRILLMDLATFWLSLSMVCFNLCTASLVAAKNTASTSPGLGDAAEVSK